MQHTLPMKHFHWILEVTKKNKHQQITSYHLYCQNGMMVALDHALLRFLSACESYAMNNL